MSSSISGRSRSRSASTKRIRNYSRSRTPMGDDYKSGPGTGDLKVLRVARNIVSKHMPYLFKSVLQVSSITSATTLVETGYNYALSLINGYTQYTALFDQFRIVAVETKFIPRSNVNQSLLANAGANGPLYTAIDYDNINATGAIATLLEYDNVQVDSPFKVVTRKLCPCPQTAALLYGGGGTNAVGGAVLKGGWQGTWFDCGQPTVEYFGVRSIIAGTTIAGSQVYDVYHTYFIQCRNTR